MFLISGEPGIGKTRLAEQISAEATTRGAQVVWGRCWEGAGAPAYWPIIQILRGLAELAEFPRAVEALGDEIAQIAWLVPELIPRQPARQQGSQADRGDPGQARFRLFDAVARLIKALAASHVMLLVIDDLHNADAAALQMLSFVVRILKDAPVLLVGTHREAEVERLPELRAQIAELARESDQLRVGGLTPADTAELVRIRTGLAPTEQFVAALHETTNGNPLFLGGVVQMLVIAGKLEHRERLTAADLKLPPNVRGAIRARLAGISTQTKALVSVAAFVGNEFDLELLERVSESPGRDVLQCLDEAVMEGVIEHIADSPGRYRFVHALIREVICDAIGSVERHRLHRRCAEEIEKLYVGNLEPHLQELAYHYIEASPSGTAEKAIEYAIRAGDAAYAVFAYAEAGANWKAAVRLIDLKGGDDSRRASVLMHLGDEMVTPGPKAIDYLEDALRASEKLGDWRSACEAHIRIGVYCARANMIMDLPRSFRASS